MLEHGGVASVITTGEIGLGFVPLDTDLLSLEMEGVFKQVNRYLFRSYFPCVTSIYFLNSEVLR